MKKLLFLSLLIPALAQSQDVDSLKRYNDKYTKSAISAFTYNRLHTLINNMLTLIGQGGGGGGTTVAMRSNGGYIQVQYNGGTWNNLVALSELQGPQGIQGIQGTPGTNGTDGREIELTANATHIQWRYVGGSYTNLVALSALGSATTDAASLITGILSNDRLQNIPQSKIIGLETALTSKVNVSDTSNMLAAYRTAIGLRATQSALQDSAFALRSAIATGGSGITIDATPTDGSANAVSSNGVYDADQLRLLKSDTASMLLPYANKINTKIGLPDTSAILAPYQNAINARVRYTDTASMLLPYANKINTKYGSADTSALLSAYRNAINARVKYTDTAGMLAAYWQALQDSVDVPIDAYPTLGSTIPASSGGTREKLDSIIANMGSGGATDATIIDGSTNAVQGNAVFDALALKANLTALSDSLALARVKSQWFNVRDYGATGDGTTNDAAAIQAAFNAARLVGGTVFFPTPSARYLINSTITIEPASGTEVQVHAFASGGVRGVIRYGGSANTPAFSFNGLRFSKWTGVNVEFTSTNSGLIAFDIDTKGSVTSSAYNNFELCHVVLGNGTNQKGWRVGHTSANNGDISCIKWDNCRVYGNNAIATDQKGWLIEGPNTLQLIWDAPFGAFLETMISNSSDGDAAFAQGGGSWYVFAPGTSQNQLDYEIQNTGSYSFFGGRYESGGKVLKVNAGSATASITFDNPHISDYQPSDARLFDLDRPVSLVIDNPNIWSDNGPAYTSSMIYARGSVAGSYMGKIMVRGGSVEAASGSFFTIDSTNVKWRVYIEGVGQQNATQQNIGMFTDRSPFIDSVRSLTLTGGGGGPTPSIGTYSTTQIANGASYDAGTGVITLHRVGTTGNGIMDAGQYNRIFGKVASTWATGTNNVSMSNGMHDITISATGARTLTFTNQGTTFKCAMYINNTSGATSVLTLPANSFVQNVSTGVYEAAASVTLAQGRTILSMVNYDGTNYWFNY